MKHLIEYINENIIDIKQFVNIFEATFQKADWNKHDYDYVKSVIKDIISGDGAPLISGEKLTLDDFLDKEKLEKIANNPKDNYEEFNNICKIKNSRGNIWTKIDKSPYSGKGSDKSSKQMSGQDYEILISMAFNIYKVKTGVIKNAPDILNTICSNLSDDELSDNEETINALKELAIKCGSNKDNSLSYVNFIKNHLSVLFDIAKNLNNEESFKHIDFIKKFQENNMPKNKWGEYGVTDNTPKTDVIACNTDFSINSKYKFSLKKIGGSQLMSDKYEAVRALFYSVADLKPGNNGDISKLTDIQQAVFNLIEPYSTKESEKGKNFADITYIDGFNITDLQKIYTYLNPNDKGKHSKYRFESTVGTDFEKIKKWYISREKDINDEIKNLAQTLDEIDNDSISFTEALNEIFNKGELQEIINELEGGKKQNVNKYKYNIILELITGNRKFGEDSPSAANYVMKWSVDNGGDAHILTPEQYAKYCLTKGEILFRRAYKGYGKKAAQTVRAIVK